MAEAPDDEAGTWARAHPDVRRVQLPSYLEALATALDAELERFEEAA